MTIQHAWLPMTIREFIASRQEIFESFDSVIVSSVDSDTEVCQMGWAQAKIEAASGWAQSLRPLTISGRSLVEILLDADLLTGFDEIWIPGPRLSWQAELAGYLVAPTNLEYDLPNELRDLFRLSGCILGIGDGEGLNIVWDMSMLPELMLEDHP
jgi:hypothetical protein